MISHTSDTAGANLFSIPEEEVAALRRAAGDPDEGLAAAAVYLLCDPDIRPRPRRRTVRELVASLPRGAGGRESVQLGPVESEMITTTAVQFRARDRDLLRAALRLAALRPQAMRRQIPRAAAT